MSPGSLISDAEKDQHKTRDQLLNELAELRALLAAKTESLTGRDRLVGMLDGITEPVFFLDDESHVIYGNSASKILFGQGREAIEGRSLWDLYPMGSGSLFHNAYERARKSRSMGKFREKHRLLGKWFDVSLYPVSGGMTVLFNDITTNRQIEELPRLALTLLHNLKDNVFLLRADGRLFHVNNETKKSLGYSSDELHSMDIFDVVPADYQRKWQDILNSIRQHRSMTFESLLRARDGHEFPVEVCANHIELYGSSYYTVSARDITERKQAEETLRNTSDYLESLINYANAPIIVWGPVLTITRFNHAFEHMTGYAADEMVGRKLDVLFPEDGRDESLAKIQRTLTEHWESMEIPILRKDGGIRIALWNSANIYGKDGTALLATIAQGQDITERKQVEEALQESEEKYRVLVEQVNDFVWEIDENYVYTYASPWVRGLLGYEPGDVVGTSPFDYMAPEEAGRVKAMFNVNFHARRNIYLLENTLIKKDGGTVTVETSGVPKYDDHGKFSGYRGIDRDITERKRAEAQAEMYLDLMGHDIKNINMAAMGYLELALEALASGEKLDWDSAVIIEKPLEALNNSTNLIRNVQRLQRVDEESTKLITINLSESVERAIAGFAGIRGSDLTIEFESICDCDVNANELLSEVFSNLIGNSIKHFPGDRQLLIHITVKGIEKDGRPCCEVAIEDNGAGISDEQKGKLFRRFARGETKARGSGLGLYMVKMLVESYGGSVRVEDRVPGDHSGGARFIVLIPAAETRNCGKMP